MINIKYEIGGEESSEEPERKPNDEVGGGRSNLTI